MQTHETLGLKLVITGNPVDGLFFYGPFETGDEAIAFAEVEHDGQDYWISTLRHPVEVARENASTNHQPLPPLPISPSELLETLDNVSALAQNLFAQHKMSMTPADRGPREKIITLAREICDAQLRGPDKVDPDDEEDAASEDLDLEEFSTVTARIIGSPELRLLARFQRFCVEKHGSHTPAEAAEDWEDAPEED